MIYMVDKIIFVLLKLKNRMSHSLAYVYSRVGNDFTYWQYYNKAILKLSYNKYIKFLQ